MHLLYIGVGISWFLGGITGIFDGIFPLIIEIFTSLCIVMIISSIMKAAKEAADEMATENLSKAKARTLDIMHLVFCVMAVLIMILIKVPSFDLNWPRVLLSAVFIEMGTKDILIGFFFSKLEAE